MLITTLNIQDIDFIKLDIEGMEYEVLSTLKDILKFDESDLLITIRWNTDMTDVDLHVHEPSGEECS